MCGDCWSEYSVILNARVMKFCMRLKVACQAKSIYGKMSQVEPRQFVNCQPSFGPFGNQHVSGKQISGRGWIHHIDLYRSRSVISGPRRLMRRPQTMLAMQTASTAVVTATSPVCNQMRSDSSVLEKYFNDFHTCKPYR